MEVAAGHFYIHMIFINSMDTGGRRGSALQLFARREIKTIDLQAYTYDGCFALTGGCAGMESG